MRCRTARRTLTLAGLGPVPPARLTASRAHADGCEACRAWWEGERALTAAVESLRVDVPVDVDVTARVAAGLEALAPPRRDEATPRQLGWAAALAFVFGLGLVGGLAGGLWELAPDLGPTAARAWTVVSGIGGALAGLVAVAAGFVATLVEVLTGVLGSFASAAAGARAFEPWVIGTIALSVALMLTTIILVLGRDIRRPAWNREGSRT